MFGNQLGTGDYVHIIIEHASMFTRNFLSLKEYSNQGFDAAHSLQRQLLSRATSHDRHGYASSSNFKSTNSMKYFYSQPVISFFHFLWLRDTIYPFCIISLLELLDLDLHMCVVTDLRVM